MSPTFCLTKTFPGATVSTALFGALAIFWSTDCATAADQKVVGSTLLSLAYPFLTTPSEAMKMEADLKGIKIVSFDPRQNVATELAQVKDLINPQVD